MSWVRHLAPLAVGALALVTLVDLLRGLALTWPLDHSVGVYIVLAELARQGIVYPATQSTDLVYCTFYQPLGFLPYAALPGSGVELIASMRALVRLEVVLGLGGVLLLLRHCRAGATAATGALALLLCAMPVSTALLTCTDDPRGGLLALAGYVVFTARGGALRPWCAAPLFALAFFTKLTAPCAAGVAALVAAGLARQPRAAVTLLLACGLWTLAGYALAHGVLGWDLAGNGLRYALFDTKPARPLSVHASHFARDLVWDPVTAVVLLGGVAAVLVRLRRRRADALDAWFLAALLRAALEYRSHGTELNHLLEACMLGAVSVVRVAGTRLLPWHVLALLPVAFLLGKPVLRIPCGDATPLAQAPVTAIAAGLRAQPPAPTLCEEPLLAWLADQRPLVTDPFLVSVVWRRWPSIRAAWFGDASDPRALQRLVLLANPESAAAAVDDWYGNLHFDAQFLADVRRLFRVVAPGNPRTVLVRR